MVAAAWSPAYNWATNLISDLGNTACGPYADRFVCSPQHSFMNASFVVLGITMAIGSLLIYERLQKSRAALIGFVMMGLGGLGTILVGLFPENTVSYMHAGGAIFGLLVSNISLVVLAFALKQLQTSFRIYTFISGTVSLTAFALFTLGINLGLGQGGIERVISYPQITWMILLGLYLVIHKEK